MKRTSRSKILGTEEPQTAGDLVPALSTPLTIPAVTARGRPHEYSVGVKSAIYSDYKAGKTWRVIAADYGIAAETLKSIIDDPLMREIHDERVVDARKKSLTGLFYYISDIAFAGIGPEELAKLNPYQRCLIGSIAFDKARLSENLSTENIAIRGVTGDLVVALKGIKTQREPLEKAA